MKIADAERIIRAHCRAWAEENGYPMDGSMRPSFLDFKASLLARYPDALSFKCRGGPMWKAQDWFDREFRRDHLN